MPLGMGNSAPGEFTGGQSSLVSRIGGENSAGFQSGWINVVETNFRGLQLGLVYYAADVSGVQLGFVNMTPQLHGLQIGLVNYAENSGLYKILPIVNWKF